MGQYQGDIHLQYTFEFWDSAKISFRTAMKHLKDMIQKIVDKLINLDDGEVWPLKCCSV